MTGSGARAERCDDLMHICACLMNTTLEIKSALLGESESDLQSGPRACTNT
jgi:hypothetical protein